MSNAGSLQVGALHDWVRCLPRVFLRGLYCCQRSLQGDTFWARPVGSLKRKTGQSLHFPSPSSIESIAETIADLCVDTSGLESAVLGDGEPDS
jgi:hypothetical protein